MSPSSSIRSIRAFGNASTVVYYLNLQVLGPVSHCHRGVRGARVLEAIGQRLLHYAVRRELHAGREFHPVAFEDHIDTHARFGDVGRETFELRQSGLRARRSILRAGGRPENAKHALHLEERFASRSLDGSQRLA
jgi:hypothetical protein